jgi:hypothetical protein
MKNKLLLIIGYFLPILISLAISYLPQLTNIISYSEISFYISNNISIIIGIIAIIAAIVITFQSKVINEDNPDVLSVLRGTNIRNTFLFALIFQVLLIIFLTLFIFFVSASPNLPVNNGFYDLFALALITSESITILINGKAYGEIREKIIIKVNLTKLKNSQKE